LQDLTLVVDAENREKFAAEMSAVLGIEVIAADSAAEVVDGADVIVCATFRYSTVTG
jgi:ornithine cyclodeaminase/alanine dehydrogenase-like protein (mu-crystallin family)